MRKSNGWRKGWRIVRFTVDLLSALEFARFMAMWLRDLMF
jgi:hypothetical protein